MVRLLVPLAGIAAFFLLSLATVRILKPRQPRTFFLAYALLLLLASAYAYAHDLRRSPSDGWRESQTSRR